METPLEEAAFGVASRMVRSVAHLMLLLGLVLAGPAGAACSLGQLAELPVTMNGLQPVIAAKINGADVSFIADSGAFFSVISPASAAQLHLPMSMAPFGYYMTGGTADISIATVKTFGLADAVIPNVKFIVGGGDVAAPSVGVIGQNVLRLADVEYDFANGVLRLIRPQGCSRTSLAYWANSRSYSEFPIEGTDPREPYTRGTVLVNGVRVRVMFDTGAETSILNRPAAARAGIKVSDPGVKPAGYSRGFGRHSVETWIAPVASFQVGDEQINNTRLRIGDIDLEAADMLIGADFFLSHRVFVSNSQRKLYFTYNGGPVFNLTHTQADATAPAVSDVTPLGPASGKPTDADSFSRRGAAFAARRDYASAIADFGKAIDLAPTEPRYLYQRAEARLAARQPFLAMGDLDAELKLKPDDPLGRLERAKLRLEGHDREGVRADLDAAAAAASKEADLRLELAELYLQLDQFDLAVMQFDFWTAVHGDDSRLGVALNGRCWARALAGRELDKALSDCNAAVHLAQRDPDTLDSRGLVHLRRGEFDRAITDYDAALAQTPKLAWSLYGRGLAELKTGAKAQGDADLAAAAALAPHLADRAAKLGLAP